MQDLSSPRRCKLILAGCHPDWMQPEKDAYKLKKFKLIFDPTISWDTKLRALENFFRELVLNSSPVVECKVLFLVRRFYACNKSLLQRILNYPWSIYYVLDSILSSFRKHFVQEAILILNHLDFFEKYQPCFLNHLIGIGLVMSARAVLILKILLFQCLTTFIFYYY